MRASEQSRGCGGATTLARLFHYEEENSWPSSRHKSSASTSASTLYPYRGQEALEAFKLPRDTFAISNFLIPIYDRTASAFAGCYRYSTGTVFSLFPSLFFIQRIRATLATWRRLTQRLVANNRIWPEDNPHLPFSLVPVHLLLQGTKQS